jgi:predicted Holliday junction resolvase-like endonuclease
MPDFQTLIIVILIIVIVVLVSWSRSQVRKQYELWRDNDLAALKAEQAQSIENIKNVQTRNLEKLREEQLRNVENMKADQISIARREALIQLEIWKIENEARIRQDAITRSHAVNLGKITEHLIPYMSVFPYNPKDVRFIGSPIDLIVFDGLDEGAIREVIFLEIKTGTSALSARQKQIREIIVSGKVSWRELRQVSN